METINIKLIEKNREDNRPVCNSLRPNKSGQGLVKPCMLQDPSGLAAQWKQAWKKERSENEKLHALLKENNITY